VCHRALLRSDFLEPRFWIASGLPTILELCDFGLDFGVADGIAGAHIPVRRASASNGWDSGDKSGLH
jgi:hypothetical protein